MTAKRVGKRGAGVVVELVGDDDASRDGFSVGGPVLVRAAGLKATTVHELVVLDDEGSEVLADALMTNADGEIESTVVWAQLGLDDATTERPLPVDKALGRWGGHGFSVVVRRGGKDVARAEGRVERELARPLVLATDAKGVPLNGFEAGQADVIVSLFGLPDDGADGVRVYLVPRQHDWRVGDPNRPVALPKGLAVAEASLRKGRREARLNLAKAGEIRPGAYDFVARILRYGREDDHLVFRASDVATRRITGLVVREEFMASKAVRGGCVNTLQIAGRGLPSAPYVQFTDVFQVGESVYGALDPMALDPTLISKMVALYVVQHKTAAQWTASSALNHLAVLGGNANVQKFLTQSFCINANKRLLWANATDVGEYDVVADFGNNVADPATFVTDASYDTPLDIIDGYFVAGFRIVPDPGIDTQFANAGHFSYNQTTQGSIMVVDDNGNTVTVDVKANVFFPADVPGATTPGQISGAQGSYPVVIVAHGNSGFTNSFEGYDYLLEHLAKNGFIAASIHMNVGMLALDRARVILHHIDVVNGLFGATAANNVGIMGHSRGGEAVVVAARLNQQEGLGHAINAVISLAPTSWISNPTLGGAWATPYLVIYGSMDGDVAGMADTGFELYDRANGAVKTMAFVYGSCHDRYNTVWGDTDITAPWSQLGPTDIPKLVNADAHQKVAKAYMAAFFRLHQKGEAQWTEMLKGEWIPASVQQADGGKARVYNQYEDTVRLAVDDFEGAHTATSWQTSALGAAVNQSGLPATPQENALPSLDSHSPHDTAGLALRWDNAGDSLSFDIPVGQRDVTAFKAIGFRVTQKVASASNPAGLPQDLRLTLHDTGGVSRAMRVSKFGVIPAPHVRDHANLTKSALATLRIPLSAFTIRCAGLQEVDLTNVDSLRFEFSELATGEIEIDSVHFTN